MTQDYKYSGLSEEDHNSLVPALKRAERASREADFTDGEVTPGPGYSPRARLNPLHIYSEAGAKAGKASRRKDYTTARFHQDWCRRAVAMEPGQFKAESQRYFDEAYRNEAAR